MNKTNWREEYQKALSEREYHARAQKNRQAQIDNVVNTICAVVKFADEHEDRDVQFAANVVVRAMAFSLTTEGMNGGVL